MICHEGKIAEMKTGEGKTWCDAGGLSHAISGRGVHVVTVNDYLASATPSGWADFIIPRPHHRVIVHGLDDEQSQEGLRQRRHLRHHNELGFDYLRDNMKYRMENGPAQPHLRHRRRSRSILIDEARTPLIISGPLDDRSNSTTP